MKTIWEEFKIVNKIYPRIRFLNKILMIFLGIYGMKPETIVCIIMPY